ncbi:MAG TPA: response regulator transcription factor [Chitinophagaceae bacterium]|jgi:two-component system chemotaxis response regulator CheY|nr:response regulator transcription factor [Chitinophagaceae bacterium]
MQKKLTILIVDDNMNFVDRMINLLEDADNVGYINVSGNYDEARRLLATEEPDVVLLDINLPGKNGIELLKLIRQNKQQCEVIMITNHADDYYRQQCRDLGAKHFLDKSNDFGLVPGIIKEVLN